MVCVLYHSIGYLGNEDALICGVKGVACMAFSSAPDADAQLFSRLLVNDNLLQNRRDVLEVMWGCSGLIKSFDIEIITNQMFFRSLPKLA